jgi:hypothetical protein
MPCLLTAYGSLWQPLAAYATIFRGCSGSTYAAGQHERGVAIISYSFHLLCVSCGMGRVQGL